MVGLGRGGLGRSRDGRGAPPFLPHGVVGEKTETPVVWGSDDAWSRTTGGGILRIGSSLGRKEWAGREGWRGEWMILLGDVEGGVGDNQAGGVMDRLSVPDQ